MCIKTFMLNVNKQKQKACTRILPSFKINIYKGADRG